MGFPRKPDLERIESRELLSAITEILSTPVRPFHPTNVAAIQASFLTNPNGVQPPIAPDNSPPTPRELAREQYKAYFSGPFQSAPPRFLDQSRVILLRGIGGSTQFLHGDYQMIINMPSNPADPIIGAAYLQDRNINSGGAVGFDLTFDANSLDSQGRPTRGTFTQDPNIYGGVDFVDTANGTVTIHYSGNAATVKFKGLLYVSGITNPLRNMDLQSRGGRLRA